MERIQDVLLPYRERLRTVEFPGLLRERTGHADRVTNMELFFDLVFVFAITQLSHLLLSHLGARGLFQTALLFAAIWWSWTYTTWITNYLDPDKRPVRFMLLGVMGTSLLMSSVLPEAFGSRGFLFALAYVAMQFGRTAFAVAALRERPAVSMTFQRALCWFAVSGVFWLIGGLLDGRAREIFWLIAVAIDLAAPIFRYWTPHWGISEISDWTISGHHLAERSQLFLILSLGESILITGATYGVMEHGFKVFLAFLIAFVGSVGLWWLYFDRGADEASQVIAASTNPARLGRLAYTYLHIPLVAGVIVTAVGDELSIAHPGGDTHGWTAFALLCGPMIFLIGQIGFKKAVWDIVSLSRIAGCAALLFGFVLATFLPPWLVAFYAAAVVVGVGIWDQLQGREFDAHVRAAIARETGSGVNPAPSPAPAPAEPPAVDDEPIPAPAEPAPPAEPQQSDDTDEIPRPPTF
jgi:low temperature requirement protein LtrA